jgi:hypothetical protein
MRRREFIALVAGDAAQVYLLVCLCQEPTRRWPKRNVCSTPFASNFKDALRGARVSEDANETLMGHSDGAAKQMVHRFDKERLADAVAKVEYRGLDLSQLCVTKKSSRSR